MPRAVVSTLEVRAHAPKDDRPEFEIDLAANQEVVRVHQFPLDGPDADPCEWKAYIDVVTRGEAVEVIVDLSADGSRVHVIGTGNPQLGQFSIDDADELADALKAEVAAARNVEASDVD